jgi:hypothetical protein
LRSHFFFFSSKSDDEGEPSSEEEESEQEEEEEESGDEEKEEKEVEKSLDHVSAYDTLHQLNANLAQLTANEVIPVFKRFLKLFVIECYFTTILTVDSGGTTCCTHFGSLQWVR